MKVHGWLVPFEISSASLNTCTVPKFFTCRMEDSCCFSMGIQVRTEMNGNVTSNNFIVMPELNWNEIGKTNS